MFPASLKVWSLTHRSESVERIIFSIRQSQWWTDNTRSAVFDVCECLSYIVLKGEEESRQLPTPLNVWSLSHRFESAERIIFAANGASGGNAGSAASGA